MSGPQLPEGVGFALAVPPSWWEFDVDPATRGPALERMLEEQVRDVPELRPHRTALARLLREQADTAWAAGASYCASMVEPTEDGPVTASVAVLVVPAPTAAIGGGVEALLEPLTPVLPTGPDEPWRTVEVVEVPGAGRAGRSSGVHDVELPDGAGRARMVQMQTLVPLPSSRVLLLTCSSPVLPLAEDLLELFEAISSTLEVLVGAPQAVAG